MDDGHGNTFHPNKIEAPNDLPSGAPWVQWRVENMDEMLEFLEEFEVYMRPALGHQLLILNTLAPDAPPIQLSPGDCLVLVNDRLGVIRVPQNFDKLGLNSKH